MNFVLGFREQQDYKIMHLHPYYPAIACNMAFLQVPSMPYLLEPCLLYISVLGKRHVMNRNDQIDFSVGPFVLLTIAVSPYMTSI